MADFYDSYNNLTFEEVPLETFLGAESARKAAVHSIIAKIANNDKTVIAGIESLMYDEFVFTSFERAITLLITAKTEQQLQRVEAALQVTTNEIKNNHAKNSQYISHKKASLYLYTLQKLIFNLDKWKLPGKKYNLYKPQLTKKLQYARFKCKYLRISDDTIRLECFTDAYQQPYDENLRNFEFLDEQELDGFIKRIERYETTHNSNDIYKRRPLNELYATAKNANNIDNLIAYIKAYKGIRELTLHYYTRNFHSINDIIAKYVGSNDLYNIYNIAESLKDYLQREEQFKAMMNNYDNGRSK